MTRIFAKRFQLSLTALALASAIVVLGQPAFAQTGNAGGPNVALSGRPALATSPPMTSLYEVSANDPIMQRGSRGEEHYARSAAQSLIERYGMLGVAYQDKTIRPDQPITTGEAAIMLKSGFDLAFGMLTPMVTQQVKINGLVGQFAASTNRNITQYLGAQLIPRTTCAGQSRTGTIYTDVAPTSLLGPAIYGLRTSYGLAGLEASARQFTPDRPLTWGQARACLPKGKDNSFGMFSYALKRNANPQDVMTRGDFIVVLNRQMDQATSDMANLSLSDLPAFQPRAATPVELAASQSRLSMFRSDPASWGKLMPGTGRLGPQSSSFVNSNGQVRLGDVAADSRVTEVAENFAITSRSPEYPSHNMVFIGTRSLGASFDRVADAARRFPLTAYQGVLGPPARSERDVYQGWSRLGGQAGKPLYPVAVFHRERTILQRAPKPTVIVRTVHALIETPSGLIVHRVESPQVPPEDTRFSFVVLEMIATDVGLGAPMFSRVATLMPIDAPAR